MRRVVYVLMVVVVAAGAGVLVAAVLPSAAPLGAATQANDAAELAFRPHPGARLPLATHLVDERGRAVALGDYFAKTPVIVVMEYLRCTSLCGVTLRNLIGHTLNGLPLEPGRDYQVVAISIDPRDKPADAAAARAKYVRLLDRRGAGNGVHFLTGSAAAVRRIADTIGFPYRYDRLLDAYIHPAGFVIAASDGVISRYVEGIAISRPDLIGALGDAQQGRSQGPLTRLLLLCHVQGVPLGRLTVPVMAAFTIADIAAGIVLIATFTAIVRRRHG